MSISGQFKTELASELAKMNDPEYQGVAIIHIKDMNKVLSLLIKDLLVGNNNVCLVNYSYGLDIKHNNGSDFYVRTSEKPMWHFDHAGMQYTGIIMECDCFGYYDYEIEDLVYTPVSATEAIPYMISRLRSSSQHEPRLVVC